MKRGFVGVGVALVVGLCGYGGQRHGFGAGAGALLQVGVSMKPRIRRRSSAADMAECHKRTL